MYTASLDYLRFVCINPSIISLTQNQNINRKYSKFSTNTTLELCKVVDSYYQVKAVDNTSKIYTALETTATNTVKVWVSLMLLSIMCIYHKDTFAMYVALTNQLTSA